MAGRFPGSDPDRPGPGTPRPFPGASQAANRRQPQAAPQYRKDHRQPREEAGRTLPEGLIPTLQGASETAPASAPGDRTELPRQGQAPTRPLAGTAGLAG